MTIYLDVIWLLNFFTDYLLLKLTGIVLKREIYKYRLMLSSALASFYVFAIFTPYAHVLFHPVTKFIFSMIIVYIAFRFKRFSYFIQNVFMFYFVSFMIGGGLIAMRFFLQTESQLLNQIVSTQLTSYGDPLSWLFVFIGFPLIWYFSRERLFAVEYRTILYNEIATVLIYIEDKIIELKGLIDSGNLLTDPITKAPVMIMDITKIDNSLRLHELCEHAVENHPWKSRVRLIPYRTVGQEELLVALRPDRIEIIHHDETYVVKYSLVGLSNKQLSNDHDFECILHPKMLLHKHAS